MGTSSSWNYRQLLDGVLFESSNLVIRAAQQADLTELVDLLSTSFHSHSGMTRWFLPILRMGMYEDLRQRLRSPASADYICLVAIAAPSTPHASIVGTVEVALRSVYPLQIRSLPYPYLSNLAVQPAYRRRGVAQKLLKACEEIVLSQGLQDLYLHVLEDNYPARQLYFKVDYGLKQSDPFWCSWLFRQPRRFLLHKQLTAGLTHLWG
ncbi:GNAT family N-acetyltransferase [Leptothermofonsia sichuanensis E412]|uniref:GNAT family N-acetyltransferase n=1 Tax=Leptothermofonsia sichuanensis TaxID=2917832 RepID=UPI001CA74E61|nr:GNAT family N-acetyltransferase [Leptothermofonsia sichuanensis]QZZ19233.1 GNAT family N-acetyltransferase [Leptothermofonsia sichuanensis E412]